MATPNGTQTPIRILAFLFRPLLCTDLQARLDLSSGEPEFPPSSVVKVKVEIGT